MRKPVARSRLRLALGTCYYRMKRYAEWYFGKSRLARQRMDTPFPFEATRHQTPLIRQLNKVDLWLQLNKIKNLQIAVNKLNGIVIHPGETFSYWKLIGKPTRRKGYVEGMVLFYGSFKPGIGGGLCQLSNLIYWMTLHTPLLVTERHRHSYDVFPDSNRTQPFGSGATCAYNYLDLQITNPTDQPYCLQVYLTDNELVGSWSTMASPRYVYEVYEKQHRITQQAWGGYTRHNVLYRRVYNEQRQWIADEYITENHALMMYHPFLESGKIGEGREAF